MVLLTEKEQEALHIVDRDFVSKDFTYLDLPNISYIVLSNLAKKGYLKKIGTKSPMKYQRNNKTLPNNVNLQKNISTTSITSKANNQYIGKYFELCIVSIINKETILNPENYSCFNGYIFSEKDKETIYAQAEKVVNQCFNNSENAKWIGQHTESELGDILINDQKVEIKRVSNGTGTYGNMSVTCLQDLGFDFKNYLLKFGIYDILQKECPDIQVNFSNVSPISAANAKIVASRNIQSLKNADEEMRKALVQDVSTYLKNHPSEAKTFYLSLMFKGKKNGFPDKYIIYNYSSDTIEEIDIATLIQNNNLVITNTDKGIRIGNIRLQLGWQNRLGNNPTIRTFI